jgi:hypothetical protein
MYPSPFLGSLPSESVPPTSDRGMLARGERKHKGQQYFNKGELQFIFNTEYINLKYYFTVVFPPYAYIISDSTVQCDEDGNAMIIDFSVDLMLKIQAHCAWTRVMVLCAFLSWSACLRACLSLLTFAPPAEARSCICMSRDTQIEQKCRHRAVASKRQSMNALIRTHKRRRLRSSGDFSVGQQFVALSRSMTNDS